MSCKRILAKIIVVKIKQGYDIPLKMDAESLVRQQLFKTLSIDYSTNSKTLNLFKFIQNFGLMLKCLKNQCH